MSAKHALGRLTGTALLSLLLATGCGSDGNGGGDGNADGEPSDGEPSDGSDGEPSDGSDGEPSDGSDGEPSDGSDGEPSDGSDGEPSDGSDGEPSDGSDGEPSDGDAGPELCGVTDTICHGDTPVCVEGQCVECSADESSACEPGEVCNAITHACESSANTPFALDCANLPGDGACQGGPREVLLVSEAQGTVLMFDPTDGHYLGVFKRRTPGFEGTLWTTTQGPDQCIWTSGAGDGVGIDRLNTDGTFKDHVIPTGHYYDGQDDVIQNPRAIAFSATDVYVASTAGTPNHRVLRFPLATLPAPEEDDDPSSRFEIAIDNGAAIESLVVLGDGSLVGWNKVTERVERLSSDGSEMVPLYSEVESFFGPTQISYAGSGRVLGGDSWNGFMFRVDVDSGEADGPVTPLDSTKNIYGTYQLGNGNWLYAGDGSVESLDWDSSAPTGQHERLYDDAASIARDFRYVGRACLPSAFVEERATPDAPVEGCAEPAGATLFEADFEDGTLGDFVDRQGEGTTVSVDTMIAADGSSRSLKIEGAPGGEQPDGPDTPSGVIHTFTRGVEPSYVSYSVRVGAPDAWAGYFVLNSFADDWIDGVYATSEDGDGYFSSYASNVNVPYEAARFYRVEMRDFDWEARTYDLYIDCERVADDIAFRSDAPSVTSLELYNLWPTDVAWYDQIVIK